MYFSAKKAETWSSYKQYPKEYDCDAVIPVKLYLYVCGISCYDLTMSVLTGLAFARKEVNEGDKKMEIMSKW